MIEDDNTIKKEIIKIISKVARIDESNITDHASLRNDLWIDSLLAMQIIAQVEKQYNIEIEEVEIFNVDTIIDIVELIKEYLDEKGK